MLELLRFAEQILNTRTSALGARGKLLASWKLESMGYAIADLLIADLLIADVLSCRYDFLHLHFKLYIQ